MSFSDFMAHLQTLINDPPAATAYAESYVATHNGAFPVVEDDIAHFIYKKSSDVVVGIAGDWNGFDGRKSVMTPIGGNLLHYQHSFETDARLDYIFVEVEAASAQTWLSHSRAPVHAHTLLDPLNSRVGASAFGAPSELAMPGYQRPLATKQLPGIPPGTLREGSMKSKILHQERSYAVYLPADYNPDGTPYPCVYFHDGGDYLKLTNAPIIL